MALLAVDLDYRIRSQRAGERLDRTRDLTVALVRRGLVRGGGTLAGSKVHTLGHNLTDTAVTRFNSTFVGSGPYRCICNPMYTGVLMLGLGLALDTWLAPSACSLVFTFMLLLNG